MDSKPVIDIYTTRICGYCHAAKRALQAEGLAYTEYDVSNDYEKRAWLVENTQQRTVPQIFIDGVSLGGYTELRAALQAGQI